MRNRTLARRLAMLTLAGVLAAGPAVPAIADPEITSTESVQEGTESVQDPALSSQTETESAQTGTLSQGTATDTLVGSGLKKFGDQVSYKIFRLYNPNAKSGSHFYTTSADEKKSLVKKGWRYEGVIGYDPMAKDYSASTWKFIYRCYNPNTGEHLYVSSQSEWNTLSHAGWKYEGLAWVGSNDLSGWTIYGWEYSIAVENSRKFVTVPLYRLYNPNAKGGDHFYTTNAGERDSLKRAGWKYDGIVSWIYHRA